MYKGLKKRKTYDEMINYLLHNQEIINYPNRSENKIKEWIDQKFDDYNLYKEMRLQDEIKQKRVDKLLVDKSTQKTEMLDKSIQKSEMLNKSTQKSITVDKNVWVDWNDVGTQTDDYLLNIPPHEDFDLYPGPEVLSYYNYKYIFIKQYDKIHKTTQMIRIQNDTWERVKELLLLASFGVFNYVGTAVGYFIWQFTPTPVPIGIPIELFTSTFSNLINLITLMPSVIYIPTRGLFDGYNIGQHLETGASIFQGFSDIIN